MSFSFDTKIQMLKMYADFNPFRGRNHFFVKDGNALATNGHVILKVKIDLEDGVYNFDEPNKNVAEAFNKKFPNGTYDNYIKYCASPEHFTKCYEIKVPLYPAFLPEPLSERDVQVFLESALMENGTIAFADCVPVNQYSNVVFLFNFGYLMAFSGETLTCRIGKAIHPMHFTVSHEVEGWMMGMKRRRYGFDSDEEVAPAKEVA